MARAFDTYSKYSIIYKSANYIGLISILYLVISIIFYSQLEARTQNDTDHFVLYPILFCILIGFGVQLIFGYCSDLRLYVKDSELIVDTDTIQLDNTIYKLKDLQKIELKIIGYRGGAKFRTIYDGTDNTIKINQLPNYVFEKKFALNSKEELEELKRITKHWKQTGTAKIIVDGFDLI